MNENTEMQLTAQEPAKPVDESCIHKFEQALMEYQSAKQVLDARVIENEKWWRQRHWDVIKSLTLDTKQDPEPTSAWLFNSIANKHADAMDNYPQPVALPRSSDDKKAAELLSSVLPVVLEQSGFQKVYSDNWWDKIISGTAVYGIFWNKDLLNGLGDVEVTQIDILNLFWEPNVKDIQKSKYVFNVSMIDKDELIEMYPNLKDKVSTGAFALKEYEDEENTNTNSDKVAVVDCYYKKSGKVHYCKFSCSQVIYASENDKNFEDKGFYAHGKYPFVCDVLFPIKNSSAGFGYVDVCKSNQLYIDKLNQVILKNALISSRPRMLASVSSGINEDEYADLTKDIVHVNSLTENSIMPIQTKELSGSSFNVLNLKIDEIKETSGNRDFSQGSTSAGVTSGAAIAALQEAGSKLSRDMLKRSYDNYAEICRQIVDLMRQYYDMPRYFRIRGQNGEYQFLQFDNEGLLPQQNPVVDGTDVDMGNRLPIFDINIKAQKSSPFSTLAQNEMFKEMFGMGIFNPQMTDQALLMLEGMTFEGKEELISKIQNNGTMYQMIQNMSAELSQLKAVIGINQQTMPGQLQMPQGTQAQSNNLNVNNLGDVKVVNDKQAQKSKVITSNMASVK